MLPAALAIFAATAPFFLGYAFAIHVARRRPTDKQARTAAVHEELERQLIKLGAGLGVGA